MSYRPYLEPGALRQMQGLPEQAFDMLVALLVRIYDPYDPVFSAIPSGSTARRALEQAGVPARSSARRTVGPLGAVPNRQSKWTV